MAHAPGERARAFATVSVALAAVEPAPLTPLEREHLAAFLRGRVCDLSLRGARAWAMKRGVDPDAVCARALELGAVCDCELRMLLVR